MLTPYLLRIGYQTRGRFLDYSRQLRYRRETPYTKEGLALLSLCAGIVALWPPTIVFR